MPEVVVIANEQKYPCLLYTSEWDLLKVICLDLVGI